MLQVLNSIVDELRQAKQNLFKVPESARSVDSSWYVGMAIDPVEFSRQMSKLQISLQAEPVRGAPLPTRAQH
ncbi:MAG TPA: hypothetical protein VFC21_10830 [Bryobacteraceae bacterium]|nr:hypothetical protein [Bryobacteraceae bacterium]